MDHMPDPANPGKVFMLDRLRSGERNEDVSTAVRNAADDAIKENELLYQTLYDNISEGFALIRLLYDEHKVPVDSIILKTNAAFEEQSGLRSSEVIGVKSSSYRPNQEPAWLILQDEVLKSGEPMHFEQYRADSKRWYDIIIYPYGKDTFCQILRDITAHKQTTGELRESRELLNAIIQAQAVSVIVFRSIRDENDEIIDFESIYGGNSDNISRHDLQTSGSMRTGPADGLTAGLRLSKLFPNAAGSGLLADFSKVVEEDTLLDREYQDLGEAGGWYHLKATKFRDGIVLNFESITERKKIEQDLLSAKEELAKRATDRYMTLFNTIDEGFSMIEMIYDDAGQPADIQIVEANAAISRMMGYEKPVSGRRFQELWPQAKDDWLQRFAEIDKNGKSARFTIWSADFGRCLDVYATPVHIEGKKQIAFIFSDITDLMLAEESLRRSETRYRELVKYAPAGIYEINFRTRKFTSVNDVMCELTGYTREELLSMTAMEILDQPSQKAFQSRIQKWLAGEEPSDEVNYRVITKNGGEIYVHLSVHFVRDDLGHPQGATVIGHDITERVRAEMALRLSEQKFRDLVQYAPTCIYEIDCRTNKFSFVNDLMCQLTGYSRDELLAMNPMDILADESKHEFARRSQDWLEGVRPSATVEYKVKAKDGHLIAALLNGVYTMDEHGRPLLATVIAVDISDRKLAK
jgi:PAS domain S-box-containing protein